MLAWENVGYIACAVFGCQGQFSGAVERYI